MTPATPIELPDLGSLYRRAALEAARSKLSANGTLKALPKAPVVAAHPGITEDQAEQYRTLFAGEAFDGVYRSSLPSTLIHIAGFPVQMALMSQDDFPLPLLGMVHLSNEVHHHKPIAVGTPLQMLARAQNLAPHRRGTQTELVIEVYPGDAAVDTAGADQLLYSSISTYLGMGTYLFSEDEAASPQREEFVPPQKTGLWTLGADAGRQYAAVSGDYNPIHLTGLTAKLLGQKQAIVHGMYSAARMLEGREPETAGHRWSITFEAPIALPGKVAFAAEHIDEKTQRFVGWNPRKRRRHFTGELVLP
ncbi:MaoC/PaaZ C-terminal domain-containing protein [Nesterenkonia muleiensis]|uniref:MaoC/PaaZ C-terminal domain-containing protein n=1 Tax=Nesterenkonia muleiensis TaxID=2282648 RepID=UPI000E7357F1|nr:MaoC/PaaZ C-terminal domain-containing protein [Nesterenkonia muleiensis]